MLDIRNRPQWYVIEGGSRSYIEPLVQDFKPSIRLNSPVTRVERTPKQVAITSDCGCEYYDGVIFACHSDQALGLLKDPTDLEQQILGVMHYQANDVVLHTDTNLLPRTQRAWASWNYWLKGGSEDDSHLPAVTYNMNILQHLRSAQTCCVTLNRTEAITPEQILREFVYHHPVFSIASIAAQSERTRISGTDKTWYCGAYWYNGFHEDGVRSALDVVEQINAVTESSHQGAA